MTKCYSTLHVGPIRGTPAQCFCRWDGKPHFEIMQEWAEEQNKVAALKSKLKREKDGGQNG